LHLLFDIFQGIGIAAAVGIRPFLPTLAVGALAAAHAEIHFNGTDYSFLQSAPFLLALVVAVILVAFVERRLGRLGEERGPTFVALAVISAVLGALLFAGSLARGHYASWPGLIGGVVCAAVGLAATRPLFARVRARLDADAAGAVPLYAEGAGVVLAVLSVLAPPIGLIGLAFLLWLLLAGRRREGQKYAGIRILR
jgi:branched-subunit amino acid transport protein